MRCPHCDDPKGIIWIDGVPEPCCDKILTAGARRDVVNDDDEQRDADDRNALLGSVL